MDKFKARIRNSQFICVSSERMSSSDISKCVGNNGQNIDVWSAEWKFLNCSKIFFEQMFTINGRPGFNRQGYEDVQSQMNAVFDNYITRLGLLIGVPGESGYNEFQEQILETCTSLPGSCDIALSTYCHSCLNCSSRQSISLNLGTLNFCGCYAPSPTIDIAKITPECDTFCTRIGTIPLSDNNGNALSCNENVCVISDVTIQATETTLGGEGVTFDQVCNTCSDGCKCIISGASITETLSSIGTTFNQSCGTNSVCISTDDGIDKVVDCKSSTETENKSYIIWIVVGSISLIVFIILLVLFFKNKK